MGENRSYYNQNGGGGGYPQQQGGYGPPQGGYNQGYGGPQAPPMVSQCC